MLNDQFFDTSATSASFASGKNPSEAKETTKERLSLEENLALNQTKFKEIKSDAKDRANRFMNHQRIKEFCDKGFNVEYHVNVSNNGDMYLNVYVTDTKNPVYADIPWKRNSHYFALGKIIGGKYSRLFLTQDDKSKQWNDNYNGFVGAVCNEIKTYLFLREFPIINEEIVTNDCDDEVEEQMQALKAAA